MDNKVLLKMVLIIVGAFGLMALKGPLSRISVKAFTSAQANSAQTISVDEQRVIHHYETLDSKVKRELTAKSKKALVALEILNKKSDFSACNSICNRPVSDSNLDSDNLTAYLKQTGQSSFENPRFVQDLVLAKMTLNNSSRALMEFEANGFDIQTVKTNASARENLLKEVRKSANRVGSDVVVERNEAFITYVNLNHSCVEKAIQPSEALKTCKEVAKLMDVPR